MPRTSNKAQMIVDYVNEFIQENGYSPSVREIGAAVGLRSTASVSYHLQALQEKGLLQSPGAKGRKRAIVTTQRPGQIPVVGLLNYESVLSLFPSRKYYNKNHQILDELTHVLLHLLLFLLDETMLHLEKYPQ